MDESLLREWYSGGHNPRLVAGLIGMVSLEFRRESVLGVKEEFIVYIIPGALDLRHIVSK